MSRGEDSAHSPPAPILVAALALLVGTIALTGIARRDQAAGQPDAQAPQSAAVLAEARLQFVDRPDGAVDVFSEGVSRRVATLAPGTNGFIRGVLRGMVRERRLRSVPADARSAFILRSRRDGSLSIEDSATGRAIDLRAFGPTNAGAFARLLAAAEASDGQRFAVARAVPP